MLYKAAINLFAKLNVWLVEHMGFDVIFIKRNNNWKKILPASNFNDTCLLKFKSQKNSSTDKHLISLFYISIFRKIFFT